MKSIHNIRPGDLLSSAVHAPNRSETIMRRWGVGFPPDIELLTVISVVASADRRHAGQKFIKKKARECKALVHFASCGTVRWIDVRNSDVAAKRVRRVLTNYKLQSRPPH